MLLSCSHLESNEGCTSRGSSLMSISRYSLIAVLLTSLCGSFATFFFSMQQVGDFSFSF